MIDGIAHRKMSTQQLGGKQMASLPLLQEPPVLSQSGSSHVTRPKVEAFLAINMFITNDVPSPSIESLRNGIQV